MRDNTKASIQREQHARMHKCATAHTRLLADRRRRGVRIQASTHTRIHDYADAQMSGFSVTRAEVKRCMDAASRRVCTNACVYDTCMRACALPCSAVYLRPGMYASLPDRVCGCMRVYDWIHVCVHTCIHAHPRTAADELAYIPACTDACITTATRCISHTCRRRGVGA